MRPSCTTTVHAPVAQGIEQQTSNLCVGGSIPPGRIPPIVRIPPDLAAADTDGRDLTPAEIAEFDTLDAKVRTIDLDARLGPGRLTLADHNRAATGTDGRPAHAAPRRTAGLGAEIRRVDLRR